MIDLSAAGRRTGSTLFIAAVLVLQGCTAISTTTGSDESPGNSSAGPDRSIEWVFLQINDVYEIMPSSVDQVGGLERVATLRKQLINEGNHVVTVMAGDFLSPSAAGNARVDGERLAGKQMVAMLNSLGVDYATFGNHEFDIKEEAFRQRLGEADFIWVAGNVQDASGLPFPNVLRTAQFRAGNAFGDSINVGIVSAMLTANQAEYVRYSGPIASIRSDVLRLRDTNDILIGLTHLTADDDALVAEQSPELKLIMGGHEHTNMLLFRGDEMTPVAKADANARSAYVHRMGFDPVSRTTTVRSEFVPMTTEVARDEELLAVGDRWLQIAFDGFNADGFDPTKIVARTTDRLDGLESSVRVRSTTLTRLVAEALRTEADAEIGLFNAGSIRIDDVIPPGPVTQYDVIRVLPFPGNVLRVEMTGQLLERALSESRRMRGAGGYLQTTDNVAEGPDGWFVDGKLIEATRSYTVGINDFLASGNEAGLNYIDVAKAGSGITLIDKRRDMRFAVIDKLAETY